MSDLAADYEDDQDSSSSASEPEDDKFDSLLQKISLSNSRTTRAPVKPIATKKMQQVVPNDTELPLQQGQPVSEPIRKDEQNVEEELDINI